MDGVTAALELEIGLYPAAAWYASRLGESTIHYGESRGHVPTRMAVMKEQERFGHVMPR
jgi:hypothetical protein